ncbi:DUF3054 domain-containing protein [Arthrobacter echini]|uniref:DUF3054 domain-containing protein n=1 Tax=Arthrobacter echini TaxID=1529066 RepID=A0A5D0XTY8_9MICC|nr:DUF3054 domain-containing protein [Arthrobacter echini]TYC99353.1 DUF3054 domain-containing protein [Arthrobacter echini]
MARLPDSPAARRPGRRSGPGGAAAWTAADVALILVFATLGRRTHEHGITPAGILQTAWPFLSAYAIAATAVRSWRSARSAWPTGVVLWLGTVAGGLLLRALAGASVALSFQLVTLLVLGGLLLLPRLVGRALARRRSRVPVA